MGFWKPSSQPSSAKAALMKSADTATATEDVSHRQPGLKQVDKLVLQDKGFTVADEKKIVALKDFVLKQAHNTKA